MACEQLFAEQLRRHGMRMTAQRARVLAELHGVDGYATADEIHALTQRDKSADAPIVDISTVYRTLELLRVFGLVATIDLGDGQTRYELIGVGQPHLHLVCQGCGGIFVVPMSNANPLLAGLLAQHGFEASLDDVTIPGLCATCRAGAPDSATDATPDVAGQSSAPRHLHSH